MILVFTVGSASCDQAVDQAALRSSEIDMPVRLVYIADTTFLGDMSREVHATKRVGEHLDHIGRIILKRQQKRALETAALVESEVVRGDPLEVVPELIARYKVDELFVGRGCLDALARLRNEDDLLEAMEATGVIVHVVA